MPYKDNERQVKYTTAYNLVHKQQAKRNQAKSLYKTYVRDFADDIDLEELRDMIRARRQELKG